MENMSNDISTVMSAVLKLKSESSCQRKTDIVEVNATGLLKKIQGNEKKTYIYILEIVYSDGNRKVIDRRYCDLVGLDNSLASILPISSAEGKKSRRKPRIPDRIKRTKHLREITEYFECLLQMNSKAINETLNMFCQTNNNSYDTCLDESSSSFAFQVNSQTSKKNRNNSNFLPNPSSISSPLALTDYRVRTSYESVDKRQINLKKDDVVQLFKKCDSGWWYVIRRNQGGWYPAAYLDPLDDEANIHHEPAPLAIPEKYKTICNYESQHPDELSFKTNSVVNVERKKMDGWWIAECDGRRGYVPATYLRPCVKQTSGCFDMCSETLDMKTAARSGGPFSHSYSDDVIIEVHSGIDLMPAEECTRDEEEENTSSTTEDSSSSNSSSDRRMSMTSSLASSFKGSSSSDDDLHHVTGNEIRINNNDYHHKTRL